MNASEKETSRARLIASGIIRFWQYEKSMEVHQWLELWPRNSQALRMRTPC
jgi:hypothetical protein